MEQPKTAKTDPNVSRATYSIYNNAKLHLMLQNKYVTIIYLI